MIDEKAYLCQLLTEIVADVACGNACADADIFKENGEWMLFMEGFMAPWPMGKTVAAFEANLREYTCQGHGLG